MTKQKPCVICGKPFYYNPAKGRATCSPECAAQRRKNLESSKEQRTCVICRKVFYYPPQKKKVTCSPECAAQRLKNIRTKNQKPCVVCGKPFYCGPSNVTRVTCSLECSRKHHENKIKAGVYAASSRRGVEAKKNIPHLSRTEKNIHAKRWIIQAPDGKIYEFRNLTNWLREHADLLDGTPKQARVAFANIKLTRQNKARKRLHQWKGWNLVSWGD